MPVFPQELSILQAKQVPIIQFGSGVFLGKPLSLIYRRGVILVPTSQGWCED